MGSGLRVLGYGDIWGFYRVVHSSTAFLAESDWTPLTDGSNQQPAR